jgi:PIN domain nuclease of toxin-antitoxin system
LLLATHVLIWAAAGHPRLTVGARALLREADQRCVSAASAYEIAYKARLGRLRGGQSLLDGWARLLSDLQADELPLSVAHMARAGQMTWEHRDPFDRMLVAQSQLESLSLLTDDAATSALGDVRTIWP